MKDADLEKMRHTLSHVLAAAVEELYPTVMFGIGPAIDEGFYYDIDFGENKVSDTDLIKIEQKMREIIAEDLEMTKENMSRTDALNWARENKQQYKAKLKKVFLNLQHIEMNAQKQPFGVLSLC